MRPFSHYKSGQATLHPALCAGWGGSGEDDSNASVFNAAAIAAAPKTNAGKPKTNAGVLKTNAGKPKTNAGVLKTNAGEPKTNAGVLKTNAGESKTSAEALKTISVSPHANNIQIQKI